MSVEEALDSHHALFLRALSEPSENSLDVLVQEARFGAAKEIAVPGGAQITGRPIEADSLCALYRISFPSYVAYQVIDERFALPDPSEEFTGKNFRRYSSSPFLELVRSRTAASDEFPGPGPLVHFCLVCELHILEIISASAPLVSLCSAQDWSANNSLERTTGLRPVAAQLMIR